eukprot:255255-Pyramimonas_sp.AAC.2
MFRPCLDHVKTIKDQFRTILRPLKTILGPLRPFKTLLPFKTIEDRDSCRITCQPLLPKRALPYSHGGAFGGHHRIIHLTTASTSRFRTAHTWGNFNFSTQFSSGGAPY